MSLKLHVFPPSPRAFKVQAAANHLGLDYELCFVNLAKGDQKRPEHLGARFENREVVKGVSLL